MDIPWRARTLQLLLVAALIVAVGLLVRVGQRKQAVQDSLTELARLARHPHAGMYVPVYEGLATAGQAVRLGDSEAGRRQILYFFTTSCPYCRASLPAWRELSELVGDRADVYGIAVDSSSTLGEYEIEHSLPYPIVQMVEPRFTRLFRVTGVPLTMVVDPGGQVIYARRGEFSTEALMDSVMQVLDTPALTVPGTLPTVPSVGDSEVVSPGDEDAPG